MFKSTLIVSKAILSIILLMSYLINAFPISSQFQPSESIVLMKRSPVHVEQTKYHTTPSTSTEPRTETRTYRMTEKEDEQKGEKEKAFSGSNSVSPSGKGHLRPIKIEAHASSAPSSPVKNSWKMKVDRMHDKVKYHNTQIHVVEPRRLTSVKSESDLGRLTSRRPRVTFATEDQLRKTSRIDHAKSNYPGISSSANVFTRETIETLNEPKEKETQGIDHILRDVSPPTQNIHSTKRWRKGTSERR